MPQVAWTHFIMYIKKAFLAFISWFFIWMLKYKNVSSCMPNNLTVSLTGVTILLVDLLPKIFLHLLSSYITGSFSSWWRKENTLAIVQIDLHTPICRVLFYYHKIIINSSTYLSTWDIYSVVIRKSLNIGHYP